MSSNVVHAQAVVERGMGAPHIPDGVLLVDGHALAYRMHFALQQTSMTTRTGEATHALHGFCTKLLDLHKRWPTHRMLVCFDLPGGSFARNEELPEYKANRPPMPTPLQHQIEAMMAASDLMGAPALKAEGFEADDLIAACVAAAREQSVGEVLVCSGDKDLLQLVSEDEHDTTRVAVWNDKSKELIDAQGVVAKYGVRPSQMADLLALMGDASDNVPGIPGIGAKLAAKLLSAHGDLEAVLSSASNLKKPTKRSSAIVESAELARQARRLVQLDASVPLEPRLILGSPPRFDVEAAALDNFLSRWELFSVKRSVQKLAREANAQRLADRKQACASTVLGGDIPPDMLWQGEASGGSPSAPKPHVPAVAAATAVTASPTVDREPVTKPAVAGAASAAGQDASASASGASSAAVAAAEAARDAWDEALRAETRATQLARDAERAREAATAARAKAVALTEQLSAARAGDDAMAGVAPEHGRPPCEASPKLVSVLATDVPF